ncbi:hypothetical protein [Sphaerotilus mobilis]|uniref:Uncharacterized protein n=1 Tax=Sphaerotilus mobilis TaxID=47994 RepID=A0A4Q7LL02_9BURK|nr:hypothetical protein [Sphaerotilus mobilis]RZS54517.1 hypothetical protein EV685_1994 [Sphaerotilus mobilis]
MLMETLSFRRMTLVLGLSLATLLTGCAATQVQSTGELLRGPLCQPGSPPVSTVIYWAPQWRVDQKEPVRRELAALRGIQDFAARTDCLAVRGIHRLSATQPLSNDAELQRLPGGGRDAPALLLLVVVRELGPRLEIGLPWVLEGGTEASIEVRVLDTRTSTRLANAQTLWRNGGRWVIKGVGTLDRDMSAALTATLMATPSTGTP